MSWRCSCGITNEDLAERCSGCRLTPEESNKSSASVNNTTVTPKKVPEHKIVPWILAIVVVYAIAKFLFPIFSDKNVRNSSSIFIERFGVTIKYTCVTAITCRMNLTDDKGRNVKVSFAGRPSYDYSPTLFIIDNAIVFNDLKYHNIKRLDPVTFNITNYDISSSSPIPFDFENEREVGYFSEGNDNKITFKYRKSKSEYEIAERI